MALLTRFRPLTFALLLGAATLFTACVTKGKYLTALQTGVEAGSEAASAKTDYRDAMHRVEQLQLAYAHLLDSLEQETAVRLTERSGSIGERQQLINQATLQGLLIDSLQEERDRLHGQRLAALAVIEGRNSRLERVQTRIITRLGTVLTAPLNVSRTAAELTVYLPESALLTDRKTPAVSQAGDNILTLLAAALGGQPDLRIEVAAEPRDLSGSPAARLEAGRRAAMVVSNLVEGHGLDPSIVTAMSLQTDPGSAVFAPAEAGAGITTQVRVTVRVAGDVVGEISQALRD